jgi:hypothetical protein
MLACGEAVLWLFVGSEERGSPRPEPSFVSYVRLKARYRKE